MKASDLHRKSDTLIIKDSHKRAYLGPDDRGIGETSWICHPDGRRIGETSWIWHRDGREIGETSWIWHPDG